MLIFIYIYMLVFCLFQLSSDAISIGPEVEYFDVELVKDDIGLGITVVGYFSEKSIGKCEIILYNA